MGPGSTAPFLDRVYAECQSQYGASRDADYPHILLYSLPTPYEDGRDIDHGAMRAAIAGGVRRLALACVDFVAVPCSTAHRYFDEIRPHVGIPLMDMVAATVVKACEGATRVGVLATPETLAWGGYRAGLLKNGVEPVVLEAAQPLVDHVLARLTEGARPVDLADTWRSIVRLYRERGVERLIVGCTDLSAMIGLGAEAEFVDAAHILARISVAEYVRRRETSRA
ncbi:aspartate/glutamate racemase family protein [Pendulispora rubella]|uniref:Aspartate/glutamate racemase family protein n=2 Tax=Pendulispora rubella TaxID=2741070 RepID=A0ABZ2LCF5_9BACT